MQILFEAAGEEVVTSKRSVISFIIYSCTIIGFDRINGTLAIKFGSNTQIFNVSSVFIIYI